VRVRLGLEPEPGCSLDRTPDAAAFLARDVQPLLGTPAAWEHLGLCYDVCHQAVMHEDVEEGLDATRSQGVAVAKAQLTCALEATDPRDPRQREALGAFDETTYLHQVGGRGADGAFRLVPDLGPALAGRGGLDETAPWRVHFHVPLFRRDLVGGLSATRPQLETLLARVAARPTTSHLEIETYTFDVLPESEKEAGSGHDLVDALEREYRAVLGILARHGVRPVEAGEDR
jgi:hypothetical protein